MEGRIAGLLLIKHDEERAKAFSYVWRSGTLLRRLTLLKSLNNFTCDEVCDPPEIRLQTLAVFQNR